MENSLDISKITNPNGSVVTVNHSNNENPLLLSPNVIKEPLKKDQSNISGNILKNTSNEELDNPEIDEEEQDDDPEVLEEIDRRHDEIISQFMEMSVSQKHDERERFIQANQEMDEEYLEAHLMLLNKQMDKKRK